MIYKLRNIPKGLLTNLGREIQNLFALAKNNIDVADTIIISAELFESFSERGAVEEHYILEIIDGFKQKSPAALFIQTSSRQYCIGLYGNVRVQNNHTHIKYTIEKIYRSFYEEAARAYRVVHSIPDEDAFPALLIQPYYEPVFSLTSRAPSSGEHTNRDNYTINVHNKVDTFYPEYEEFLRKVESIIRKPSKIYFTKETLPRILAIKDQVITDGAIFNFLSEYYENGLINSLDYLLQVTRRMILQYTGNHVLEANEGAMSIIGIPASPGIAKGKLTFKNSDLAKVGNDSIILAVRWLGPEDTFLMHLCSGAIQTEGGETSHLAVISRGLGIPAVVGADEMRIDHRMRIAKCRGVVVPEFYPIILDGISGKIILSGEGTSRSEYKINDAFKPSIGTFRRAMSAVKKLSAFKRLPVDAQKHIAELQQAMRKLGLLP